MIDPSPFLWNKKGEGLTPLKYDTILSTVINFLVKYLS